MLEFGQEVGINGKQKNYRLTQKLKDGVEKNEGEKYRVDELKFLNKQLTTEIEDLRLENYDISEKLRYSSEVLEKKYEENVAENIQKNGTIHEKNQEEHSLSGVTDSQINPKNQRVTFFNYQECWSKA